MFGLEDGHEWTYWQIGLRFGIDRSRGGQVVRAALAHLRHAAEVRGCC